MSSIPPAGGQPVAAAQRPAEPYREMPTRIVLEQSRGGRWRGRLGWILFLLALVYIMGMFNSYKSYFQNDPDLQEKYFSGSRSAADKIAIISIEGTIMGEEGFVKSQIDRAREDDSVKGIVLRVDSPGGTVTGSAYDYHHLVELVKKKRLDDPNFPLVVSMGGLAASGGYYVSMAVGDTPKSIYAEPSTWTGSIGVVIPHYDVSELLVNWNIKDDSIASNPLKLLGSPTRKVTPELAAKEKVILQALVDGSFKEFKDVVMSGRPAFAKNPAKLDELATGQVFTAEQAKKDGLVDEIGYIEAAIDRALELAHLNKENVRVVKYIRPKGLLDEFAGASSRSAKLETSALLDLTAPRAYYVWTLLPSLVANRAD